MADKKKYKALVDVLEDLSTEELVEIHNKYCEECNYPDDVIYPMWRYEEMLEGTSVMDLTNMLYYGDFNPLHNYFWYHNDNLYSSDWPGDSQICIGDIVNAMLRNDDGFGNDDCQDIIDEDDDEEEQ